MDYEKKQELLILIKEFYKPLDEYYDKYLKKEVKNGNINSDKATKDFTHILEVSLAAVSEVNTESFEKALDQNKKNIEDQIEVFKQVKINSIY